ncbi:MAG: SDR family oxidoreductase, partial [Halieaceae bacterium]|nr:SDR family oxidoreductase [Halieaceae bacterium]
HVRVNCVAPGWIKTAWGDQASREWQERAVRECLLNRWGEVGDIADAVRWLVSTQASFITGQIINLNGGFRTNQT